MRRFLIQSALIAAFTGALAAIPVLLALLGAPVGNGGCAAAKRWPTKHAQRLRPISGSIQRLNGTSRSRRTRKTRNRTIRSRKAISRTILRRPPLHPPPGRRRSCSRRTRSRSTIRCPPSRTWKWGRSTCTRATWTRPSRVLRMPFSSERITPSRACCSRRFTRRRATRSTR